MLLFLSLIIPPAAAGGIVKIVFLRVLLFLRLIIPPAAAGGIVNAAFLRVLLFCA